MAYEIEDEVDWSDGTIDDPPFASTVASADCGYATHYVHEHDGLDYLFESQETDDYQLTLGETLPSATPQPPVTPAQCTRIGVRLNRRQPSEQDYAHFALYQANQKAYEATFLKHFVTHALHPSQIEKCFNNGINSFLNLQRYIASISAHFNAVANKIVWNAHCRTVSLLANAGKDGVPFWDINSFDRDVFADFEPNNPTLVAQKLHESWHRIVSQPSMVRYTTKDYPIGHHSSPFEEIDEVADTLFNDAASLPPGRTVRRPTTRKGKGRGMPGAQIRDSSTSSTRDNWLASLVPPRLVQARHEPSTGQTATASAVPDLGSIAEPRLLSDVHKHQGAVQDAVSSHSTATVGCEPTTEPQPTGKTQLERLFDKFGADALDDDRSAEQRSPVEEHIDHILPWPTRLFRYHKQRLTQRSPRLFRRALPGIRAVIADAIARGYQPVDPDFEKLIVDIEAREQAEAAVLPMFEKVLYPQALQEEIPKSTRGDSDLAQEAHNGKKRRREQPPPIRMFNKPVEPRKKKRKVNVGTAVVDPAIDVYVTAQTPRRQKILARPPKSTNKSKTQKPSRPALSSPTLLTPLPPHPSSSATLEPHQHLPPTAYFTPQSDTESPAWRCGIKHALGHYYNSGDRKNCPGCFTAVSDNPRAVIMDFYLPSRTHYHQPNPTTRWRPSKPFARLGRARRAKALSHNSVAKEAYWAAIAGGADDAEAMKVAIAAVMEKITPKPRKEPTPPPEPEPEPDLGPHPSGSATMEHGQDLPSCASFAPLARSTSSDEEDDSEDEEEEPDRAWRCDVNHALGRYYMAGDRRSCPGCGSNKNGAGKSAVMDFWLPRGVVVRQDVDTIRWKPRKPYKVRDKTSSANQVKCDAEDKGRATLGGGAKVRVAGEKGIAATPGVSASTSSSPATSPSTPPASSSNIRTPATPQTHNQLASRKYFSGLNNGLDPTAALQQAIQETEAWADGERDSNSKIDTLSSNCEHSIVAADTKNGNQEAVERRAHSRKTSRLKGGKPIASNRGGREDDAPTTSLALNALRARNARDVVEEDEDELDGQYETDHDEIMHDAHIDAYEEDRTSSDEDDESSGSDSE